MSGNVSLIDGHIDEIVRNENICVCCGSSIPEGKLVCHSCASEEDEEDEYEGL